MRGRRERIAGASECVKRAACERVACEWKSMRQVDGGCLVGVVEAIERWADEVCVGGVWWSME